MIAGMKPRIFRTAAAWRAWLEKNHDKAGEIWLAYYKKGTGKTSVTYEEALREALCFGWIDSKVRKIDGEKYGQRYTPRNEKSIWSAANKKRIAKLRAEGRLAPPGLRKIAAARKNGSWERLDGVERIGKGGEPPRDLLESLDRRPDVREKWDRLPPSQRKLWTWWVESAKRPETRIRRIEGVIAGVAAGRYPGM
jgi:uncharacterized protein YdeI (YjbR/CyaY-like superfamily)